MLKNKRIYLFYHHLFVKTDISFTGNFGLPAFFLSETITYKHTHILLLFSLQ